MKSNIRAAWFADIFDEVSGVVTDTIEVHRQAQNHNMAWYPLTCYHCNIKPFHVFKPALSVPTGFAYKGSKIYIPDFRSVISFLKKKEINIIISNTPAAMGFMAMRTSSRLKIPWVDIYHTDVDFYLDVLTKGAWRPFINRIALAFVKVYHKRANLIFVRNKDYFDQMLGKGHAKSKIRYYPPGVDINRFNPKHNDQSIWKKFRMDASKMTILFVGRITKVKDLEFLLKAFSSEDRQDAQLAIVGKGPEETLYQKQYGSSRNIHFLGLQQGETLQKIYASSDLFVLPSASETLGKTVLEAMASGLPALVSDKGGPKEHVKDTVTGRIFKAGSYDEFLKTFRDILTQKKVLSKMGKAAYKSVQGYTMDNLFRRFIKELNGQIQISGNQSLYGN